MNKQELISAIADKSNISKKDVTIMLTAFTDTITEELQRKGFVQLLGFGTFEVRERKERQGHNPATNQPMIVPASAVPYFKPSILLRKSIQ